MGRKHLLEEPLAEELTAVDSPDPAAYNRTPTQAHHPSPVGSRGAIGAVTRSIEQVRANGIIELAPDLIEPSFIVDRLATSPVDHQALVESIREHGQQVPILVRPHPEREGRYQIAYGRRRLRALAELGRPVRSVVKPLTDQQLVVAQGQENSARTDLSFIEKALFAVRLEEGGYDRDIIMAALSVDKTTCSRLISAAVKIPHGIVEHIGPAPKAGRDRWTELATRLEVKTAREAVERLLTDVLFISKDTDARFAAVFSAAALRPVSFPRLRVWKAEDGTRVARIVEDRRSLTLAIDKATAGGFAAYLVEALPEVYAAFQRSAYHANPQRTDQEDPGSPEFDLDA